MNGNDFRRWRNSYGLSQQELGDRMGVTRTTIQNWEAQTGELSTMASICVKALDRRLRQEEPLRGPVTLNYAVRPMMLSSEGSRQEPMLQNESYSSNAAALCRAQVLSGQSSLHFLFVVEGEDHDLWNMTELRKVINGHDAQAPTLRNLLRRIGADIRANAPDFVRSGPAIPTDQEQHERECELNELAGQLEKIAGGEVQDIVAEEKLLRAILDQTRSLGLRPDDTLVSAVEQALHASRK
jgi:DNA-binding XRE family transcriptional regulator